MPVHGTLTADGLNSLKATRINQDLRLAPLCKHRQHVAPIKLGFQHHRLVHLYVAMACREAYRHLQISCPRDPGTTGERASSEDCDCCGKRVKCGLVITQDIGSAPAGRLEIRHQSMAVVPSVVSHGPDILKDGPKYRGSLSESVFPHNVQ